MAAITLEVAKKHLEMWLEAESEVAINQSYTIGGKSFTRANLAEIRKQIEYWSNKVAELENLAKKKGRPYFVWELTGETKRNEPLDCRNYAQAAIEITGLTLKEPPKKKTEVQVTRKQTRRRGNRSGGIA